MFSWLFSEPLSAGTPAPDFSLQDQAGNVTTLRNLRGQNVVLIFYPRDQTSVCRTQLCEFRDREEILATKSTRVFGINPQSASSHSEFHRLEKLNFPLLVDSEGTVCRAYHTNGLFTKRTVYLIGRSGLIRYGKRGKPDPQEVLLAAEP